MRYIYFSGMHYLKISKHGFGIIVYLLYCDGNTAIKTGLFILLEARRTLVVRPVFKTGGGDEKSPRWVRFPCASAN